MSTFWLLFPTRYFSCGGCLPSLLTGVGCCSSEHVRTETTTSATTVTANSATDPEDDFFTFAASGSENQFTQTQQSRSDNLLLEYSQYLEHPATERSMLHKYLNVRSLFLRYNTPIPSTAPVECLFSFGGLIHTAKTNRLSDKMFKTLLMLKANANLSAYK